MRENLGNVKSKRGKLKTSLFFLGIFEMTTLEKIENLILTKFAEEGFEDCFLVEIQLSPANALEIFVDADSDLTLDKCRKISRFVEHHLDENGWLGETYGIEVSSPGIGRPLKFIRQYKKNIKRLLDVTKTDGTLESGTLESADDEKIILTKEVKIKEGKKNKLETQITEIAYSDIKKASVGVKF